MNIKHHLKRQVRDTEAALAPLIARLNSEGVTTRVRAGQNGGIGVISLAMQVPSAPEIAERVATTVVHDLAALGLNAAHEVFPIPGNADHVGIVFDMMLMPPSAAH